MTTRTYDIFVRATVTERHSVNAESFEHALKLFNEGTSTHKDTNQQEVHNIWLEDRLSGARKNEVDLV